MQITISNEIIIHDPTPEILAYCKKELVIDNPDYAKKERMGLWIGNTPKTLNLYRISAGRVIVPIGAFKSLHDIIAGLNVKVTYTEDLARNTPIDYNAHVPLYDYQEPAVEEMKRRGYGILQSAAGSGKTQMGVALAIALGKKTLWLTHTRDLLKQSYDRAKQYISEDLLGTITAGKVDIGEGITFATVQTLSKQDLSLYKYEWDCIIVDECHRCAGTPTAVTQFSKVLNNLAARHKYGLSATVHRADGLIKTTFMLLGNIAYTVPDEDVKNKVMRVQIQKVDTHVERVPYNALDTDGTIIYSKLITELSRDVYRNAVIYDKLMESCEYYNLILSDRLDQLHALYNMLPEKLQQQATVIDGKMTSKKARAEREQAIEDMRSGKKHFLFASYKLAKEGLDIPRLDRLHLATPQKDYAIIVQSVGRIGRTFPDKQQPVCYDYVDGIGLMQGMYKKRCTIYKKCNYLL